MKILYITEYFPKTAQIDVHGGVEARTFYIAKEFAKLHTVHVISSLEHNKQKQQLLERVNIHRVGMRRSYSRDKSIIKRLFFTIEAIRLGLHIDFDIIEGAGFFGFLPALIIGRMKKKKIVLFVPDIIASYCQNINGIVSIMLHIIEKIIFISSPHAIICISKTIAQKIAKQHVPVHKIHVIYCGVDIKEIKMISAKSPKYPTICCIARLVPYKRVFDIIHAMKIIHQKYPRARLVIIGDGENRTDLEKLVQQYNLTHVVTFYGNLSSHQEVIKQLKKSILYCSASSVEGFGIALIEAFACGVAGVVSDIPVYKEITHGRGAIFFKLGNSKDCANKIIYLLHYRDHLKLLQKQTIAVSKLYSWQTIVQETEQLYESLCAY